MHGVRSYALLFFPPWPAVFWAGDFNEIVVKLLLLLSSMKSSSSFAMPQRTSLLLLILSYTACDALRAVSTILPRPSSASVQVLPDLAAIGEGYQVL